MKWFTMPGTGTQVTEFELEFVPVFCVMFGVSEADAIQMCRETIPLAEQEAGRVFREGCLKKRKSDA